MPKRLVIFVEGKGDVNAVPMLAQRVVIEIGAQDAIFVDPNPFRVRGVATLVKNNCYDWLWWLNSAGKTRPNIGGVMLKLDADAGRVPPNWRPYVDHFRSDIFCPYQTAALLGLESRAARAGEKYSLATVFAKMEFETWLLAGVESLRGQALADNRGKVPNDAMCPIIDLENIRGAKERLKQVIPYYDQSLDQGVLARAVDLKLVRSRCRSFLRFCSAIQQLADAVRNGAHVVTPPLTRS